MSDAPPSLKWLSTFRALAHCGSVQVTARQTGSSVSSVSHHIQCLEKHLGTPLIDHAKRPMVLTARGAIYLRYVEDILALTAKAEREAKGSTASQLQSLRFAMIEDYETDIGPEITQQLASALPKCHFTHYTRDSHEILMMLRNRALDIGIATQPQTPLDGIQEIPLLRDPFVLAVPTASDVTAEDCLSGTAGLPFLRYMRGQMMGTLIEAQLSRMRIKLPNTFELDSTASIMSLVARNSGWAMTTPSSYARAQRFQNQVCLLPLPNKGFSRTISMFVAEPHLDDVAGLIASAMRSQLSAGSIAPMTDAFPWLAGQYRLITESR